jgi:hypothetical protein
VVIRRRAIPLLITGLFAACQTLGGGPLVVKDDEAMTRVRRWSAFEQSFQPLEGMELETARVDVEIMTPSRRILIGGFADRGHVTFRFTPDEEGLHWYRVFVDTGPGPQILGEGAFTAISAPPEARGFVRRDHLDPRRLADGRGETFLIVGESHDRPPIPESVEFLGMTGMTTLRVTADTEPEAAKELDRVFEAAERQGVYVILTLSKLPELKEAAEHEIRRIRDRWAHSTSLLAIDLPGEPERAEPLASFWRSSDPYEHIVTTRSEKLFDSPKNDVAQIELDGTRDGDVHALAEAVTTEVERARRFAKPILLLDVAPVVETKEALDVAHVGMWSAIFSGAGALATSAPSFALDTEAPVMLARAKQAQILSSLVRDFERRGHMDPNPAVRAAGPPGARAWSLGDRRRRLVWVLAPKAGYGRYITEARVAISDLASGTYMVTWLDDVSGKVLGRGAANPIGGQVVLEVPPFSRHAVARLSPVGRELALRKR